MLEVHFLIDAPQDWIKAISQGHSALVRITDIKSKGSQSPVQDFVDISSPETRASDIIDTISESKNVKDVDLVPLDHHRVKGMVKSQDCPVCSTLAGLSCSLISASTRADRKMEWKVLISGENTLKRITDRLSSNGIKFEITQLSHISPKSDLTPRQEQIAKIALDLGYFEFPKRIGIEELSKRLGISAGNLSEILRRAEKHILSKYFEEHRHD